MKITACFGMEELAKEEQAVFRLAVEAGEMLLKNGAEIFRVQDTITHILEAYEIRDYNVYVISNGIFATMGEGTEKSATAVRHIPLGAVNLEKIITANQISREICEKKCSLLEGEKRLEECRRSRPVNERLMIAACGMGSACFCYLFGGSRFDALIAFFMGVLLQLFLNTAARHMTSKFITGIIGSALVTFAAGLVKRCGIPISFNQVIIGAIIPLVPGVVFTNSIREFFNGDYLSGGIHLIDALMTAACIAIGVGSAIPLIHILLGGGVAV